MNLNITSLNLPYTFYYMSNIELDKFNGFEVEIDYKPIMKEYADKTVNIVKTNSPKGRRGKYAQGWRVLANNTKLGYEAVVWNETDWQLTHLLENGHLIVNKRGGVGWASSHPHIQKSYDSIKSQYVNAMENVKVNIIAK